MLRTKNCKKFLNYPLAEHNKTLALTNRKNQLNINNQYNVLAVKLWWLTDSTLTSIQYEIEYRYTGTIVKRYFIFEHSYNINFLMYTVQHKLQIYIIL